MSAVFSEKIGEATRRGQAGALTRNRLHGVPYGYRKIVADTGLNREINPAQAAIVRRIFEEAAGGRTGDAPRSSSEAVAARFGVTFATGAKCLKFGSKRCRVRPAGSRRVIPPCNSR